MRGSHGTNPAAGRRFLGVRRHTRQVNHQVEAHAAMETVAAEIFDAVQALVRAHAKTSKARGEIVEANRIACGAQYEAPEQVPEQTSTAMAVA